MSSSSLSSIDQDGEVQSSMAAPADGSFEAADISAAQAVPPAADLSVSDAEVGSCFFVKYFNVMVHNLFFLCNLSIIHEN